MPADEQALLHRKGTMASVWLEWNYVEGREWCQEKEEAWGLMIVTGQIRGEWNGREWGFSIHYLLMCYNLTHLSMKSLVKLLASWDYDKVLSLYATLEWMKSETSYRKTVTWNYIFYFLVFFFLVNIC